MNNETKDKLKKLMKFWGHKGKEEEFISGLIDDMYASLGEDIEGYLSKGYNYEEWEEENILRFVELNKDLYKLSNGNVAKRKIKKYSVEFNREIKKSGNSLSINIPSEDINLANLKEGDLVKVTIDPIYKTIFSIEKKLPSKVYFPDRIIVDIRKDIKDLNKLFKQKVPDEIVKFNQRLKLEDISNRDLFDIAILMTFRDEYEDETLKVERKKIVEEIIGEKKWEDIYNKILDIFRQGCYIDIKPDNSKSKTKPSRR